MAATSEISLSVYEKQYNKCKEKYNREFPEIENAGHQLMRTVAHRCSKEYLNNTLKKILDLKKASFELEQTIWKRATKLNEGICFFQDIATREIIGFWGMKLLDYHDEVESFLSKIEQQIMCVKNAISLLNEETAEEEIEESSEAVDSPLLIVQLSRSVETLKKLEEKRNQEEVYLENFTLTGSSEDSSDSQKRLGHKKSGSWSFN